MKRVSCLLSLLTAVCLVVRPAGGCTGITLRAEDGSVVFARTMEWGTFDLRSRLVIVPRGQQFTSELEGEESGVSWEAKYGAVGLDALEKGFLVDGMNEQGFCANVFYHPGFAEYPEGDPGKQESTLSVVDVCQYLLTTCATVADAKAAIAAVTVVGVLEPAIGIKPPIHLMVTEPSGKAAVIEFVGGQVQVYDAPLGVITNAPAYDWHVTNLRNYLNLSPVALPSKRIEEMDFGPLGGGSGMIGLPGDFTPPSRFVRAVAFTQTARPTETGDETLYEVFRILDNFNLPLGSAEGEGSQALKGMRSATNWTSAYDTKNLVMQYHTMHNRRVRQVDLKRIDFGSGEGIRYSPLDREKAQDIEDATPR